MNVTRIESALARAREDAARRALALDETVQVRPARRLAIGDPQAPLHVFFTILEHHRALGDDGRLARDVHLVSMGDHFDWGPPEVRPQATEESLALLAWLAAHHATHTTILLGNHDLARVSELASYDDATYVALRAQCDAAYRRGDPDETLERALLADHPELPAAEMLARDYSCFRTAQRDLVTQLLRARRMRIALAASDDLLLVHAGVTADDLAALNIHSRDPQSVAAGLNAFLDERVAAWRDGPLSLEPLHRISSRDGGEARGIFYQRPSDPTRESADLFAGPPRRRFDPRSLPLALTQAVGHIRDGKCRKLLGDWAAREETRDGPLRHLITDGTRVHYARGMPSTHDPNTATMLFLDSGMNYVANPHDYELLDVDRLQPAAK